LGGEPALAGCFRRDCRYGLDFRTIIQMPLMFPTFAPPQVEIEAPGLAPK